MDKLEEFSEPLMSGTPVGWQALSLSVQKAMINLIKPTVTPLSVSEDGKNGSALGTGSYFAFGGLPYLITAEHVVAEAGGATIVHLPIPDDYYVALTNHFQRSPWPIDTAITRLSTWPDRSFARQALSTGCFDVCYKPAPRELFFWVGFPGSTAGRHEPLTELRIRRSLFGSLPSSGLPILSQSSEIQEFNRPYFDSGRHFLLCYPTTAISKAGGPEVELRNPKGMSGSLVWDAKWVAATQAGIEWGPEMAKVCGLAWSAPDDSNVIVATKVEYVRPVLLQFLREEAAYFRWVSNGHPRGTELADWLWARDAIPSL
jgi:hypothetical protein